MEMIPVVSSNLISAGYNSLAQELTIQFRSGVYTYSGVPKSVFDGLLVAPSKGKYHHQFIKPYPFRHGY